MAFLKFNKSELVNLSYSLKREILLASKTGAYCNTSIVTCNTRRYHGLLAVPVERFGGYRYMLLSSLDESLTLRGKRFNLGVPMVTYKIGEIVFRKSLVLSQDANQLLIKYELVKSPAPVRLELKPFLSFRRVHDLTRQNEEARTAAKEIDGGVSFNLYEGFPDLNLQVSGTSKFNQAPCWYNGVTYSDEMRRGFDCREDLFVPGSFDLRQCRRARREGRPQAQVRGHGRQDRAHHLVP